jgi:hypothetical protein
MVEDVKLRARLRASRPLASQRGFWSPASIQRVLVILMGVTTVMQQLLIQGNLDLLPYADPYYYRSHHHATLSIEKNNTMMTDWTGCSPALVRHDTLIPIFILSRDRLDYLRHAIQSYNSTISSPYEIIILDHHSTYPPMLDYLRELKSSGVRVLSLQQQQFKAALTESAGIISRYLDDHPEVEFYVFTDSDIALERTPPDILLFFAGLLRSCPALNVVGPHMQISDIPTSYPKHDQLIKWESQFWKGVPKIATWNSIGYHFSEQRIDTTFAMRRRGQKFERHTAPSVRTFAPYSSVHLDWYSDAKNLPEDKMWYITHTQGVNHW